MAEARPWVMAAALLVFGLAPVTAGEPGDLGRDAVAPWPGDTLSQPGSELFPGRTGLALADSERDMADRMSRFFSFPDRRGWIAWFQRTRYDSASTRYRALDDAVLSDLATLPAVFASICSVIDLDRQRQLAAAELAGGNAALVRAVLRRVALNGGRIGAFAAVLGQRYDGYGAALDRLLVETPDRAAQDIDHRLNLLAPWVAAAAQAEYCASPAAAALVLHSGPPPTPRVLRGGEAAARK